MQISPRRIKEFQRKILRWYEINKRDLPWRKSRNPYHILLSEFMSQQTQLSRVIPKYEAWLNRYPTIKQVADSPTRDILFMWSGLGYNRRALYLQKTAQRIVLLYGGIIPSAIATLRQFPGIGEYTASAIMCFAFNAQIPVIDTNIRKIIAVTFFHGVLPEERLIKEIVVQLLPSGRAYEWNQALMDFAATELKKEKIPLPKQAPFKQSDRYFRGQIIKVLIEENSSLGKWTLYTILKKSSNFSIDRFEKVIKGLVQDKLIEATNNELTIAEN